MSGWNPAARALWLIAGSFLLGFVAFQLMTLLARWLGKSPVPQFILAVGIVIVTVGAAQAGRLSVLLSLLVLGVAAGAQTLIYIATSSVALLADLIHNFGDAATAIRTRRNDRVPRTEVFLWGRRSWL